MRCAGSVVAQLADGGFFMASQFEKGAAEPIPDQLPVRGALEAKPVSDDAQVVAEGEQVHPYLEKYRQVLVTARPVAVEAAR